MSRRGWWSLEKKGNEAIMKELRQLYDKKGLVPINKE